MQPWPSCQDIPFWACLLELTAGPCIQPEAQSPFLTPLSDTPPPPSPLARLSPWGALTQARTFEGPAIGHPALVPAAWMPEHLTLLPGIPSELLMHGLPPSGAPAGHLAKTDGFCELAGIRSPAIYVCGSSRTMPHSRFGSTGEVQA